MRVIKLDASGWKTINDFYDAILAALEAPHWHGRNSNALHDSMGVGQINGVEPPYKIWIVGTAGLPGEIMEQIDWMIEGVEETKYPDREILFQVDA